MVMRRIGLALLATAALGVAPGGALFAPAALAQAPGLPPPMGRLSCSPGERVVFEVRPVDGPYIGSVSKTDWGSFFSGISTGLAMGGVGGAAGAASRAPQTKDSSTRLETGVRAAFARADANRMLRAGLEQSLKDVPQCEIVFMASDERGEAEPKPADRFVMLGLYVDYQGGDPKMTARLAALQVADPANLKRIDEGMVRLKELQAEAIQPGKRPALDKLKEFTAFAQQLMSLVQAGQSDVHESPTHKVDEWLADDGRLVAAELKTGIDALVAKLAGALRP
jgi:hypothetical protein